MYPVEGDQNANGASPPQKDERDGAATVVNLAYDVSFEYAVDAQILTDSHGVILNVNHAAVHLFMTEKGFLIGKPLGFLFKPGSRDAYYKHLAQIGHGRTSCSFESQMTPRDIPRDVLVLGVSDSPNHVRWFFRDTTRWKQAELARVELLRMLLNAQGDERRRLARDLHDNVGQLLTGLTLTLGSIAPGSTLSRNGEKALKLAEKILLQLREAVHDIAHGYRAGLLDQVGLHAALEHLVNEWHERNASVQIELEEASIADIKLPRAIEAVAYAMIQEGLTNVHRHAQARSVRIAIKHDTASLTITLRDDGKGFDVQVASQQSRLGRLGLVGMEERIALVGGTLHIDTAPGKGTKLTALIPLPS